MFPRRYAKSPEAILMNRQTRDKSKLTGKCDACVNLGKLGDIPYCKKDKADFQNRFKFDGRCDSFLHTR